MTTTVLAPYLTQQFFANYNGQELAGGQLFTYQAGTTTPVATYVDSTGVTPNTNPVILNSRGECSIWILPNVLYKFVLTDSAGNVIWTRDQVSSLQLLTLFGGTDTGAANTYLLTYNATFSSYTNGTVIYFIPSNSNTGASTININGLGVIPIVNLDGSALGANQIVQGVTTEIFYYNGVFQLISIGSLTGVVVGTFGKETPLPSAATVDLGTAIAHVVLITGTTTITSFGSTASLSAPIYSVRFASALTLTNSATLSLPGNANISVAAGDSGMFQYLGSGSWKCIDYLFQSGSQSAKVKSSDTSLVSSTTLTPDPDLQSNQLGIGKYSFELYLDFDSVSGAAGFKFTNDGTAVDSRGAVPMLVYGIVNGASAFSTSTFYGATVSYATVGTASQSNQIIYKGSLLVSTPGTFGISWAQNTSTASNTTLRAGSYLTTTLLNTGVTSGQVTRVYQTAGSFTETVPAGFTTLTLELFGASGGGGGGFSGGANGSGGGGGGSGGYVRSTIPVTGMAGNIVNFTIGAAGTPSGAGGTTTAGNSGTTLTMTAVSASGGAAGGIATSLSAAGAGGAGGAASGGTVVNTTGNMGAAGLNNVNGGGGGNGGFGIAGIAGGGFRGGNGGGTSTGAAGGTGIIIFQYN